MKQLAACLLVFATACAGAAAGEPSPMQKRLHELAVIRGDVKAVRLLLDEQPALVHARDRFGFTVLHNVVGEEHVEVARLLIARGADVNARNDQGVAPLHVAAWPGMVDLLVRSGAGLEARTSQGDTPLIANAGEPGRLEAMQALLKHGAATAARNARGRTALDVAREVAPLRGDDAKVRLLSGRS